MPPGTRRTPSGIAYDRAGPPGAPSVLLLHAGVADRRMWDGVWSALAVDHDVVRLDLRGYGDSTSPPTGALAPHDDVLETLTHLDVARCHLVGASFGAGVAVEVALTSPELAESLVLVAPGGSLDPRDDPEPAGLRRRRGRGHGGR